MKEESVVLKLTRKINEVEKEAVITWILSSGVKRSNCGLLFQ